jgi:hypothetical protein
MIAALLSLLSSVSPARAADVPAGEELGDEDPLAPDPADRAPAPGPRDLVGGPRALIDLGPRDRERGKVRLPPTRIEMRFPIRQDLGVFPYFGIGTQVHRRGSFTVDADLGINGGRQIQMRGPWRVQNAASGTLLAMWELGPWLAVGPTGGVDYRWFRQQWTDIASSWVPVVGVRVNSMLIGARKWGFVIGAGATADLARTRFVRETAEVVDLVPLEGFVSTRIVFGHGREQPRDAR